MNNDDPDASLQKAFELNVNLNSPAQDQNLNITKKLDFDSDNESLQIEPNNDSLSDSMDIPNYDNISLDTVWLWKGIHKNT